MERYYIREFHLELDLSIYSRTFVNIDGTLKFVNYKVGGTQNPYSFRGVINGKAGKAAALPNFSDTLTLSQSKGADYAHPLALLGQKKSVITPLSFTETKYFFYFFVKILSSAHKT